VFLANTSGISTLMSLALSSILSLSI
jgi:hypothetical protein